MFSLVLSALLGLSALPGILGVPGRSPLRKAKIRPGTAPPSRYIVTVDPSADRHEVDGRINRVAQKYLQAYRKSIKLGFVHSFATELDDFELEEVLVNSEVLRVEQVSFVDPSASNPPWGIDRINQRNLPLDYYAAANAGNGTGVNVYVIDSGVQANHSQFQGRASTIWTGFDYSTDDMGHGTHICGTIGGKNTGIAPAASMRVLKIFSTNETNSGATDIVLAAMDYIINEVNATRTDGTYKPSVVNMAFNGDYSPALNDGVARLYQAGLLSVVAAGNSNGDACTLSPASAAECLTVAATNASDYKASFSGWGPCVEIAAPGVSILSTWIGATSTYNQVSGTSMSAAHGSGAVAALLSRYPTLSPDEIKIMLLNNATKYKVQGFDNTTYADLLYI